MESIKKLDESLWDTIPTASGRGMNPLAHLTKFLETIIPGFEFGLFTEDDLEDRRINEGYVVLTREQWEAIAPWNEKTAFRYNIKENKGALMWNKNFICARPKKWGELRRQKLQSEPDMRYEAARRGKAAVIKDQSPDGISVGSSIVETVSMVPPEAFKEPDSPIEDLKNPDGSLPGIFTNAPEGGEMKVVVDIPKAVETPVPQIVPRKRGRPKGSKTKR